jgi:hypothetical protein
MVGTLAPPGKDGRLSDEEREDLLWLIDEER